MANDDRQNEEEHSSRLRDAFNGRVSYLCVLAALIISIFSLGSLVLGAANIPLVLLGLDISVALLAVAFLQEYHTKHRD